METHTTMKIQEIDFNDETIKGTLPIVVYSSISFKPNGELITLINIEPINNSSEMNIEIFGNNNSYIQGKITNSLNKLNIFSFRCILNKKYFIKIVTEEFSIDQKINLLFYGFYEFENHIFNNTITHEKITNKTSGNIEIYDISNKSSVKEKNCEEHDIEHYTISDKSSEENIENYSSDKSSDSVNGKNSDVIENYTISDKSIDSSVNGKTVKTM